jgi:membrane fusion protein (multidrug efflux system)
MAAFERSFAALAADSGTPAAISLAIATGLLGAWIVWGTAGRVSLYEVSTSSRVEIVGATAPLESPFLGKVVRSSLTLGRVVEAGELLVELDSRSEQLAKREADTRLAGIGPRLDGLATQLAAERDARGFEERGADYRIREARSALEEARTAADTAARDADRIRALRDARLVSERDVDAAETVASRLASARASTEASAAGVGEELGAKIRDRDGRIEALSTEIATLENERATLRARIEGLDYEIERRRIRAPVAGRVAEAIELREGAVLDEAQKIGSIAPVSDALLVVAQFPAGAALGRIRVGQTAIFRLEAFPWAEFGTVDARVSTVAQDVREGTVRVELELLPSPRFAGSVEHGMPGSVEVLIERLSPLGLIGRTVGEWATTRL